MSTTSSPRVVILAGPNGADKSTSAPHLLRGPLGVEEFVNADTIASGLSAFHPERVAFQAGRAMLIRLHELAEQRSSFALETTQATRSYAAWIRNLQARG